MTSCMFAWRNSDVESQNIKIVNLNLIGGLNLVGLKMAFWDGARELGAGRI